MAVEPYIGEIMLFAGNFAPRGWAFCNGQVLPISQNTALFSLLGTTYGGDGKTTFALPDLRGRVPVHAGQGSGLSSYEIGQRGGAEITTLSVNNLPSHSHALRVSGETPDTHSPANSYLPTGTSSTRGADERYATNLTTGNTLGNASVSATGEGQPFGNVMPYLTINFCIALEGVFPPRA
ncbi:phage tail protein [Thiothrix subterranea]|uniref:Tail fiber protein n=1 Tax=Thiothrix subterranea TaxID=2735563 RepID=A0ABU0YBA9_9GAMM|nr:tail fiber protein [Thiothrix subterranea]MDQ5770067.1 tail fiber protein [Thiothrix subterranea]